MADSKKSTDDRLADQAKGRHSVSSNAATLDKVADLTWLLLDRTINDAQMTQLDRLLRNSRDARDRYLKCVQIHMDLAEQRAARKDASDVIGLSLYDGPSGQSQPFSEDAGA